jgi:integrase
VCDGVGAVRPADLTPSAVRAWVAARLKAGKFKKKPFGPGTAANYVGAAKSFTRWLCLVEKAEPVDHLSALRRERDDSDPRRQRRALSPDDLRKLLDAARASGDVAFGLDGRERHALYLLACSTGLRAAELASLTAASFGDGTVTVEGRRAKNRRTETLPVPAGVLAVLEGLLPEKGPVWPNRVKKTQAWWRRGAAMLRRDLAAAGIAATDERGRVFDFHSLRGQFATDLDRAGVTLTRAQKLMRHSTPLLTAKHYQRPEAAELAADVAKLKRGGPAS